MTLFEWSALNAYRRYRTAPPGLKLKRRREWVMETARSLI